ncbi:hypothetical protein GCM10017711_02830 [Paeniglutamicibacter sulfureus]
MLLDHVRMDLRVGSEEVGDEIGLGVFHPVGLALKDGQFVDEIQDGGGVGGLCRANQMHVTKPTGSVCVP